ncbi:MAG: hypothetical protein MJ219_01185 [Mycoplasmoidaceae bacterium]|nr:hypothetical protein [Mycoplasmoidaceae bacterium]
MPVNDGVYYYTVPEQQIITPQSDEGYTVIRTYSVSLDANTSTGLYKSFAESESTNPRYINFEIRITKHYATAEDIPEYVAILNYALENWPSLSSAQLQELATSGIFASDFDLFTKQINDQTQTIYNIMTTSNTKLSLFLDDTYPNEVEHRFFKSINVTGTKDNIFYKIIDSNPNDTIDKMVLFADKAGRFGNHLFNTNDWAPYGSTIEFFDVDGKRLTPGDPVDTGTSDILYVPTDFNDVAETTMLYQSRLER